MTQPSTLDPLLRTQNWEKNMEITMRTLLASVASTAVLAGSAGALLTAATTSQASPQALAAAVQKVRDARVEGSLEAVNYNLKVIAAASQRICSNTINAENYVSGAREECFKP